MKVLELHPATGVRSRVVDAPAEWIGTTVRWELRQEGYYVVVLRKHQGWTVPVERHRD